MNLNSLICFVAAFFCGGLGLFVLLRDRRSFVHRAFVAGMGVLALESALSGLSLWAGHPDRLIRWQQLRLIATALIPGVWILFSLSFSRSNYREFLARIKWLLLSSFVLPVILVIFFIQFLLTANPVPEGSLHWLIPLGWSGYAFHILLLLGIIIILANLERTLRSSTGYTRWQIKFMVLGLGSLFAVRIYTTSQIILFRLINTGLDVLNAGALLVACVLMIRSLARVRILNVNLYPSHSLLYNSFTVLIVGGYFIVVGVLAQLVKSFNLTQHFPTHIFIVFIAFAIITVFLLSDRVRHQTRHLISYHLRRPFYDYRKEWAAFTEKTSRITEVNEFCNAVAGMVSETFECLSVTVWLLSDSGKGLLPGGSTVLSEGQGRLLEQDVEAGRRLVETMKDREMPVDLDDPKFLWTSEGLDQDIFERLKIRYCAPLIAGGELQGLVTVGERVGKIPFGLEEYDLLKTISDQTAASLLNIKLSERLRQAREMEAFQTMSSFVIHDLKNVASTLSLTMQNLPAHFNNPEFQEDALRVISQSVIKIKGMCGSLSGLSQRMELKKVETDLNQLIGASLACLNGSSKVMVIQELQSLSRVLIDPEQVQKVLTNLLLNAREAIENGGEVRIATEQREGWIVLSVNDTGCGMSKEFIERSLFRPFKTTKKQGMGIGLFQSRMIIEAHQGRIEVESQEGKGSTFRVMIPVKTRGEGVRNRA